MSLLVPEVLVFCSFLSQYVWAFELWILVARNLPFYVCGRVGIIQVFVIFCGSALVLGFGVVGVILGFIGFPGLFVFSGLLDWLLGELVLL